MAGKLYRNGFMMSIGHGVPPKEKRGNAQGWTAAVARRNAAFLMSVDVPALSGQPFAATLTMAPDRIPDPVEFHAMLDALLKRLRRAGALRWHWLIEFQRNGSPHLHMSVWMPDGTSLDAFGLTVVIAWITLCDRHGVRAGPGGQTFSALTDAGWCQYVAKHGSRGAKHYQREAANRPAGWENPGRMWGYGPRSGWPTVEERLPIEADLTLAQFHRLRRLMRGWEISRARQISDPKERRRAIRWSRRALSCPDRRLSTVRPVSGWWAKVPRGQEWALGLVLLAAGDDPRG